MSIHFANAPVPGRAPACSPIARAMVARAVERVANDNGDARGDGRGDRRRGGKGNGRHAPANDQMLRAALRHFAEHGLGAARAARAQAEQAFFDGDRQAYQWWLGITRTLDRRLAMDAERTVPRSRLHIAPSLIADASTIPLDKENR